MIFILLAHRKIMNIRPQPSRPDPGGWVHPEYFFLRRLTGRRNNAGRNSIVIEFCGRWRCHLLGSIIWWSVVVGYIVATRGFRHAACDWCLCCCCRRVGVRCLLTGLLWRGFPSGSHFCLVIESSRFSWIILTHFHSKIRMDKIKNSRRLGFYWSGIESWTFSCFKQFLFLKFLLKLAARVYSGIELKKKRKRKENSLRKQKIENRKVINRIQCIYILELIWCILCWVSKWRNGCNLCNW